MNNLTVYDKDNRLIFNLTKLGSVIFYSTYKYTTDFRKMVTKVDISKNKSNYKTITKERQIDKKWLKVSRLTIGEKYITYDLYNNEGNSYLSKCFNRKTKKTTITNFLNKNISITANGDKKMIVLRNLNINKITNNGQRNK